MKRCPQCQKDLPSTAEFFGRNRTMSGGLACWCKACSRESRRLHRKTPGHRAKAREWAHLHRERIRRKTQRRRERLRATIEVVLKERKR